MNMRMDLIEILKDFEAFCELKGVEPPCLYILGGSGCILANYLDRATLDIDFLDLEYESATGKLFRLLGKFDMLDMALTTIPGDYKERAVKLPEYKNIYVLSIEDIIVSKIGRYSEKDVEDIGILLEKANKQSVSLLIEKALMREDLSKVIKNEFIKHVHLFKEQFNV